jgi:hypothetical protein
MQTRSGNRCGPLALLLGTERVCNEPPNRTTGTEAGRVNDDTLSVAPQ